MIEKAIEILESLKEKPSLYCYTREAMLCRVTTVLDMVEATYNPSDFYVRNKPQEWVSYTSFLAEEADPEWITVVVNAALGLLPR